MAFDIDGVMTDGSLYFGPEGQEMKAFNTLDGKGLNMLASHGIQLAIITGRESGAVAHRARNLGIDLVFQGVHDKQTVMTTLLGELGFLPEQAGYMGDDIIDLPAMLLGGFSAAPANAHALVRQHACYVCQQSGGHGAVREVCEFILAAQGALDDLFSACLRPGRGT
jgi:3-deoxy-D-manno-octulosonate 8-phosphate phosphatase (KDO 8-P phosphatase)